MRFPVSAAPRPGWDTRGRSGREDASFGAPRPHGRRHAGCDLVVPAGTDVLAVTSGRARNNPTVREFIQGQGVYALEIVHDGGFVIRYGEIGEFTTEFRDGVTVTEGQVIGHVVAFRTRPGSHMLHFELYAGSGSGSLSIPNALRLAPGSRDELYPEDCSEEDIQRIRTRGYHHDFQRRSDLADATSFLQELQAGRQPSPPVALGFGGAAVDPGVIQLPEIIIQGRRPPGQPNPPLWRPNPDAPGSGNPPRGGHSRLG